MSASPDRHIDPRGPHPRSLSPRALTLLGWGAFILGNLTFLALAWNVAGHRELVVLDARVATLLHQNATPVMTALMLGVTHMHSTIGVILMGGAFGWWLWKLKEKWWLVTLVLAVGGGMLLNVMLKHAYERARPHFDDPMITLTTYSFPSGHTAGATLFYGVLAAFLVSRYYEPSKRAACIVFAIFAVMAVAFSRMYLGAHYFSDVVAAVCSSIAWVTLCLTTVHDVVRRRARKGIT